MGICEQVLVCRFHDILFARLESQRIAHWSIGRLSKLVLTTAAHMRQLISAVAIVAIHLLGIASGDVIRAPGVVLENTLGSSGRRPLSNAIEQLGLSVAYESGVTDYSTYIASDPLDFYDRSGGSGWIANVTRRTGHIDFDFGNSFEFSGLVLWNLRSPFAMRDFRVFSSDDSAFANPVLLGGFTALPGPNIVSPAQEFGFDSIVTRYLRLRVDSGNTIPGAAEFAFKSSVSRVPEPSATLLLGLGTVALIGIQQRKKRPV